ncbi:hypothetical protein CKO31_09220 [Thiohalocapsa halophila]|uniref:Lipoprotein n=1 Tax=Thiohalocapsa halophila TaxID=69359 RepID=A0ABS1CG98_9GAMM|nr:hypothetical protein [Thiohalocapsa halophila]MBK1630918.1 hypothetical protein [Thiohalocapsa halophila]
MNIRTHCFTAALALALLPPSFVASAACTKDAPEVGDIGPASELVCAELQRRYGGSELAVEGRSIHSPNAVSVHASVNGTAVPMRYELVGHQWHLDAGGAAAVRAGDGLSMRR